MTKKLNVNTKRKSTVINCPSNVISLLDIMLQYQCCHPMARYQQHDYLACFNQSSALSFCFTWSLEKRYYV